MMKTVHHSVRLIVVLLGLVSFAQQGINYKALIKDNGGNVVANQNITLQFIIYEGTALTNNVYQETHSPSTDANGIVILNIGEGSTSDTFSAIDWDADAHFLNVQIDTGEGLTDMGTTQFMAVPYALSAANVSGLEAINESNSTGWRLIGREPNYYGNIGTNAVDFSHSVISSENYGATGTFAFASGSYTTASGLSSTATGGATTASGNYSTAMGNGSLASGSFSIAMGSDAIASGITSTAMGSEITASGNYSTAMGAGTLASASYATAMGTGTEASGQHSTSMGYGSSAQSYRSLATGSFNVGGGTPDSWVETDPLFEIGTGIDFNNKSNALTILKNGTITAPSFDIGEITAPKSLITKEYLEANGSATGLESLDEGNGIGWRLIGRNPLYYGNIGSNAVDLSISAATSDIRGATGDFSTALGYGTIASGVTAIAMGRVTTSSGYASTAIGDGTEASANYATAMGINTIASGERSTALGWFTEAAGANSFVVGRGATTTAFGTNAVSMGYDTQAGGQCAVALGRLTQATVSFSTAMGYQTTASGLYATSMGGFTTASGYYATAMGDGCSATGVASFAMGTNNVASVNSAAAFGVGLINDDLHSFTIGDYNDNTATSNSLFQVGNGGGDEIRSNAFTVYKTGNALLEGTLTQSSDKRLKQDISKLEYGLEEVLKLKPVSYHWKRFPNQEKSLGLIAQEVQPVIKEIVHASENKDKTLSLSYTELIPVLIKAIQEQQNIIKSQKTEIDSKQKQIDDINIKLTTSQENYRDILARLEQLEGVSNKIVE